LNGFCVADNVGDGRTNDGKDSYPCSRSQIESTILATKDQAGLASPHRPQQKFDGAETLAQLHHHYHAQYLRGGCHFIL